MPLTRKQHDYLEGKLRIEEDNARRQMDFRIREYAKRALKDLTYLAEKLPDREQEKIFRVENIVPLVAATISFRTAKKNPIEVMWKHRRRFTIAAQLRRVCSKMVETFNKAMLGETGVVITPWEVQWFDDAIVLSIGKEPFGKGIAPLALYRLGEPIKYAVAARFLKGGERIGKDDLEFVAWEKCGKGPEPIRLMKYRRAPGGKVFTGSKAEIYWCNKYGERVFLGTCETCEFGNMLDCNYREIIT